MHPLEKMQAFFRTLQPDCAPSRQKCACGLRSKKSDAHVVTFFKFNFIPASEMPERWRGLSWFSGFASFVYSPRSVHSTLLYSVTQSR